jgi:c-di-GMP-binding flagellar brake protein YcgR
MGVEIQMSGARRSVENRQAKRYRYQADAAVRRLELPDTLPGRILDLSARGCLLRLPNLADFAVDSLVDVCVNSSAVTFRALGSVRHCSQNRRLIGLAFVNLSRRGQVDLLDLIAELEAAEQAGQSLAHQIVVLEHTGPIYHPLEASKK